VEFPLLGQQVAVDLANTLWVHAGRRHDALASVAVADRWVRAVAERPLADGSSLAEAAGGLRRTRVADDETRAALARLRDLVRELLTVAAGGGVPAPAVLEELNAMCAAAPSRLHATGLRHAVLELTRLRPAPARAAMLAALAEDALTMAVSGQAGGPILICPGPGCVGIVVQDNPRRLFCSPTCANRARAARHYARHRDDESAPEGSSGG
jgi:predicted RNA-binding Zn ribbon-like protein